MIDLKVSLLEILEATGPQYSYKIKNVAKKLRKMEQNIS